jgi:hypothetical protein
MIELILVGGWFFKLTNKYGFLFKSAFLTFHFQCGQTWVFWIFQNQFGGIKTNFLVGYDGTHL